MLHSKSAQSFYVLYLDSGYNWQHIFNSSPIVISPQSFAFHPGWPNVASVSNAGNGNLQIFLIALAPTPSGFDLCMSTSNCISMHRISCSPGHKSCQNFLHLDKYMVLWCSYCHTKRPSADRCVAEYVCSTSSNLIQIVDLWRFFWIKFQ